MGKRHTSFHKPEPVKGRTLTGADAKNFLGILTGGKSRLIERAFSGGFSGSGGGGGGGATLTTGSKIKKPKKK